MSSFSRSPWLRAASAAAAALALAACVSRPHVRSTSPSPAAGESQPAAALVVPEQPAVVLAPRARIAAGLLNPRGMQPLASGELLLSEAGNGLPDAAPSGRLLKLSDRNADGDFLDDGEQRVLLDQQPSKNILEIVRRDEVFGMAGMAQGDGRVLVALAFFGGPTTLLQVIDDQVTTWGKTHTNLNDVTYDPGRKQWYGVASTTDEVVRLQAGGGVERVLKIPPLESGQDPVPGYLRHDPLSGEILVSLFSGSPEGEEGGDGTELVPRAGAIIAVDPDRKSFRWLVRGLTVPTDLEVAPDGSIYVLQFCRSFLDPVRSHADLERGPSHGGFERFSGRLLHIERPSGRTTVIAEGLDAPTNLVLVGNALYVAQGMGTPGREIPSPSGTVKLEGFVERIGLQ
jgi:hypothetical protein